MRGDAGPGGGVPGPTGDGRSSGQPAAESAEAAVQALEDLVAALDRCLAELHHARDRAERLLHHRREGRSWLDIVTTEARPLVVESISSVMAALASAGGAWRREEARALQAENVSINRIAALFGVTRQRISALLRDRDEPGHPSATGTD
ncbi:MAG TPA: hypothetical protein VHF92_00390 [Geodermatophilus sp.]|nr:hypothetical protein [Geodermatophilus sp.]